MTTTNTNTSVAQLNKVAAGQSIVEYEGSVQLPIKSVLIRNSKAFKNLRLSSDTFTRDGRRVKIESIDSNGATAVAIYVSEAAFEEFVDMFALVVDAGSDLTS